MSKTDITIGLIIGLIIGYVAGNLVMAISTLESIESKTLVPMHYEIEIKNGVSDTTFVYDFTDTAIWKN